MKLQHIMQQSEKSIQMTMTIAKVLRESVLQSRYSNQRLESEMKARELTDFCIERGYYFSSIFILQRGFKASIQHRRYD